MSEVPVTAPVKEIIAKPARDYRWRRYALVLVLFVYGLYSCYDGFKRYPRENTEFLEKNPLAEKLPHPALDIPFNKTFGVALPPLSLLFLCWVWYASRGQYEFDGTTLKAPGHGTVPLKAIRKIDRSKWDRKGIAYLHYTVPGSAKLGVITLDDFIYERKPTDEIFRQIALAVEGPKTAVAAPVQQRIICTFCRAQNTPTATACINCGAPLEVKNLVNKG